jgi:hypothetical protein
MAENPGRSNSARLAAAGMIGGLAPAAPVPPVIRFKCPNCDRPYVLPDALAHLPLVCKGCAQRLSVPDPTPDPEPVSPPEAKDRAPAPAEGKLADADSTSPPAEVVPRPELASAAPPTPGDRRVLGLAADVAVALVLAAGGALLGELATRRSMADLIRNADPLQLMVWAGCVAAPLLVYLLLANRGKSIGSWLRRRAG